MNTYEVKDDDVARMLRGLQTDVAAPPPRSPAAARRTARRRHTGRLAGAAALVAAVVVGVPVGVTLTGTGPSPVDVATQETTPAPTPSQAPAVPEPSPQAGEPVPAAITGTESGPSTAGELQGLRVTEDFLTSIPEADVGGTASWDLDPCDPPGFPQDATRTGWYSQQAFIGDGGDSYQVATYPDEATAEQAVAAMAEAASTCWSSWEDPEATGAIWRAYESSGTRLSGVVRWHREPTAGDLDSGMAPTSDGTWVSVARQGRVIAVVTQYQGLGGGSVARSQGDERPGSGAGFGEQTTEEASAEVLLVLDAVTASADRYLGQAVAHLG